MKNIKVALVGFTAIGSVVLLACTGDDFPSSPVIPTADAADSTITDAAEASDALPPIVPQVVGDIDRAGRPAVFTLLPASNVTDAGGNVIDFNSTNVFYPGYGPNYLSLFQRRLVELDRLDSKDDWDGGPAEGKIVSVPVDAGPDAEAGTIQVKVYPHPLTAVVAKDYLVVDMNVPFSPDGFMEIEHAALTGGEHTTCGGRWVGHDAVNTLLSLVVSKSRTGISDGVASATKAPTFTFPFLAAPN